MNIFQKAMLKISGVNESELIDNSPEFKKMSSELEEIKSTVTASAIRGGTWGNTYSVSFDGEKNLGDAGPVIDYTLNHQRLAQRSWQSFLENDISKTVLKKFTLWIIDKGLKLQSNPMKVLLKYEGIELQTEEFNEIAEARFSIWSKSKNSSYSKNTSLNELAKEAFKHAKIGGDVLVVLRYIDNTVTVQLIDTAHLMSPIYSEKIGEGNKVVDGVEINKESGEHVAFHVCQKGTIDTERIPARSEATGFKTAFLVYGDVYRMDNVRGIPIIATSLEALKKIERYKEAAVGSAEERQKIAFSIEHEIGGSGESPIVGQLMKAYDASSTGESIPVDAAGQQVADNVAVTSNKNTYNMPIGAKMKSLESKQELFFKEFFETNANLICAAIGIPPNVAFSIYNDSFSASRAATKDWEHTIEVERDSFNNQFYVPIYAFWLFTEIIKNKIPANGYMTAWLNKNWIVTEAFTNARFTGPMFPHIDPLKEVKAEREKLGPMGKDIPLTTVEQATEVLNGGDSDSNAQQFAEEIKQATQLGIIVPAVTVDAPDKNTTKTDETDEETD